MDERDDEAFSKKQLLRQPLARLSARVNQAIQAVLRVAERRIEGTAQVVARRVVIFALHHLDTGLSFHEKDRIQKSGIKGGRAR